MKYLFVLVLLMGAVGVSAAPKKAVKSSLYDDIAYGCSTKFEINRSIPAARFHFDDRAPLEIQGEPAQRWIEVAKSEKMMAGAFNKDPVITLAKTKDGQVKASVLRFSLGCLFVSNDPKQRVVKLDWSAVKKWEAAGGYKKLGLPKKDDWNARVKAGNPQTRQDGT